jgi:ubiquinone/menaquinone biosynthesis C-methylase UbiE
MMMAWIIGILVVGGLLFLLDREIYRYEGIHIGSRLQAFLYDRWSKNYDKAKQASQQEDETMLARPLLEKITGVPAPLILDVATGTGRLPYALFNQPDFAGHVIAVDISMGMLEQALKKLAPHRGRFTLVQYQTFPLPFQDETFDVVCCVEALELIGEKQAAVTELERLLRPGGVLLTSRGTEESGRGIVVISRETLTSLLQNAGFEDVQITPWWKVFNRVFARKPGRLNPAGEKSLQGVLRCPQCGRVGEFVPVEAGLQCRYCSGVVKQRGEIFVL